MAYDSIQYRLKDAIAFVVLHRPETGNSLDRHMRLELTHAITRAAHEGARVVLLYGAGDDFCTGQDLGEAQKANRLDPARTLKEEYEPLLNAITQSPIPIIGAIWGQINGAGLGLALACDMVFADQEAQLSTASARIGLSLDNGLSYFLPRLVGLPIAMGLALTTSSISGAQAAQKGMIWQATPTNYCLKQATAQAERLAKGPSVAYRLIKETLRQSSHEDLKKQLHHEGKAQEITANTADFYEGITAFLTQRPPKFTGK